MRILPSDTAALLIDVQERLIPAIHQADELSALTVRLIHGLQILDVPILSVCQYPKGLGNLIAPVRDALGGCASIEKKTFSAWDNPDAAASIASLGKKTLVIFGIEAHICVLQTVIDLLAAGYRVAVVADCVASRRSADRDIALQRAQQEGALLTTSESLLFELLRGAGSDTFRQISALIK